MARISVIGSMLILIAAEVCAQEELLHDRIRRDCDAVRGTVYRMEDRPSPEAMRRIIEWAKRHPDDSEALYCAAGISIVGWVPKGEIDPIEFLKRAAERKHPAAMAGYGIELCTGELAKKDTVKGVALLRESAALGEPSAYYNLGTVYESGIEGVTADLPKATACYQLAIEKGMTRALGHAARVFQKRGDSERAMEYAQKAAEAGDPWMMETLAEWYSTPGPRRDLHKAAAWLERGATRGNIPCMRNLATWLEDELGGLKRDPLRSRRLLERAAELGDRSAILMLEIGRATGRFGMPLDKERGWAAVRRMAADGSVHAQFELGSMLLEGKYIDRNLEEATKWLEKAAKEGHEPADQVLKMLRERGPPPDRK